MLGLATVGAAYVRCRKTAKERSAVLENAAGFTRLDTHIYNVYTLQQTSHSAERCTSQDATSAEFLEVQIPPCVLVYNWDS